MTGIVNKMVVSPLTSVYRAMHPYRGLDGENGISFNHILSSVISIGLVGTYCYIMLNGLEVPSHLLEIVMLTVGYLFGMHYPKDN